MDKCYFSLHLSCTLRVSRWKYCQCLHRVTHPSESTWPTVPHYSHIRSLSEQTHLTLTKNEKNMLYIVTFPEVKCSVSCRVHPSLSKECEVQVCGHTQRHDTKRRAHIHKTWACPFNPIKINPISDETHLHLNNLAFDLELHLMLLPHRYQTAKCARFFSSRSLKLGCSHFSLGHQWKGW